MSLSVDTQFHQNMPQASSSSKKAGTPNATTTTTATQKTWSSLHSSAEVSSKYWSYKTTEIRMESGGPADSVSLEASSSVISPPTTSPVLLSGLSSPGNVTSMAVSGDERESVNSEVKLPKNAVELIAWAITECNTTTPTLSHIASHIQTHVPTYRDEELSVLIKMVQHHLNKNNPTYFLPVLSPAGHRSHNPNLARWAINLQVVSVGQDGSLIRRRHRSHAYHSNNKRALPPSSSSTTTTSPFLTPSSSQSTAFFLTPPDSAGSGSGHNPRFSSFSGPPGPMYPQPPPSTLAGQTQPTLGGPLPFPLFGPPSPVAGTLSAGQQPASLGPGLYGVPVSAAAGGGGMGTLPPLPSPTGMTYQLPLC